MRCQRLTMSLSIPARVEKLRNASDFPAALEACQPLVDEPTTRTAGLRARQMSMLIGKRGQAHLSVAAGFFRGR